MYLAVAWRVEHRFPGRKHWWHSGESWSWHVQRIWSGPWNG